MAFFGHFLVKLYLNNIFNARKIHGHPKTKLFSDLASLGCPSPSQHLKIAMKPAIFNDRSHGRRLEDFNAFFQTGVCSHRSMTQIPCRHFCRPQGLRYSKNGTILRNICGLLIFYSCCLLISEVNPRLNKCCYQYFIQC